MNNFPAFIHPFACQSPVSTRTNVRHIRYADVGRQSRANRVEKRKIHTSWSLVRITAAGMYYVHCIAIDMHNSRYAVHQRARQPLGLAGPLCRDPIGSVMSQGSHCSGDAQLSLEVTLLLHAGPERDRVPLQEGDLSQIQEGGGKKRRAGEHE